MSGMLQTFTDETGAVRVKDEEVVVPIIVGTVAFNMGRKGVDSSTHKWTVYVRGMNNEDLSYIVAKGACLGLANQVQFDLHHTFAVPTRFMEVQPFEVQEQGWGEFDIAVHIHFTVDVGENPVIIYHKLRLYDDGEQVGCKQDPKRPVVFETYEELVFSEPRLDLYSRLKNRSPVYLNPPPPLLNWVKLPKEDTELEQLRSLRGLIAHQTHDLRRELAPAQQSGMGQPHSAPGHLPMGMGMGSVPGLGQAPPGMQPFRV